MIKLEHVVLPSPEQMEFAIEGMRNPMNSWEKSDSDILTGRLILRDESVAYGYLVGHDDRELMNKLSNGGPVHSKYMRMMPVMVRITAPLYWWKEFDTYKVGTVSNSCSTMHKITAKEFTLDDFSCEHLLDCRSEELRYVPELKQYQVPMNILRETIRCLNYYRELYLELDKELKSPGISLEKRKELVELRKQYWWQMIQLLPSPYNQTRNIMLNYEILKNVYTWREDHKLDEWVKFCNWIETLPYAEIITGNEKAR